MPFYLLSQDLRGIEVQFASTVVVYNIRSVSEHADYSQLCQYIHDHLLPPQSYLAAESEHLLAQGAAVQLPSEAETQLCDRGTNVIPSCVLPRVVAVLPPSSPTSTDCLPVYVLSSDGDLAALLWLSLSLRAMESTSPSKNTLLW